MNNDELKNKISIKTNGSIFLGSNVVCDGSEFGISNAVFTQIHSDRLNLFPSALQNCNNVIVSMPTADLLVSDKTNYGDFLTIKENFKPLNFEETFSYNDVKITLYDSSHILGSCKVLVEDDGVRILYSSEFRFSKKCIKEADILVLDSSHGDPDFKSNHTEKDTLESLIELTRERLELGDSIIFQAERGQLQELMSYLSEELPEPIPFLAPPLSCYFADVYRKHDYKIKKLFTNYTDEAKDLFSVGTPVVQFVSNNPLDKLKILEELGETETYKIEIGNEVTTSSGTYSYDVVENSAKFNLPIHASFEEMLEFVSGCKPKLVITDNSRYEHGDTLAKEIFNRLRIPSYSYPIR